MRKSAMPVLVLLIAAISVIYSMSVFISCVQGVEKQAESQIEPDSILFGVVYDVFSFVGEGEFEFEIIAYDSASFTGKGRKVLVTVSRRPASQ